MTAHKYYKRGLVTAERFDGSDEMAKRWGLLADGPRWYTGDTIMDFLVKRGMWIIGMPRKYLSQQIITDEAFHRLYAPLPVIPQAVAYAIEWFQQNDETIGEIWRNLYEDVDDDWKQVPNLREPEEWMLDHQDTFTMAWSLGEWEVEE
ncbi:MAG: alpha-galactosidase [Lactobacillus sp.]|jgi:hypothetical protein|nr:alpha-galactosidase [Lactobacillus sp.]MCI1971991.1 alpha-galactosidase [Lactobacillus sp.]MCI2016166.1 alpha-galactosidase [Lactobacillus sp.]MCI2036401.1 alpha-galactosidase [Lactobacillus sp.]